MSVVFGICIILMCFFMYMGWIEKRVGHKKKADVYYSIGSVSMVIVAVFVLIAIL